MAERLELGVVGLGRMGANLALQALGKGMRVVGYDLREPTSELTGAGLVHAGSLAALRDALTAPRIALIYVPSGRVVDDILGELATVMEPGDILVDGGNSYWGDSIRRQRRLAEQGLRFLDCGTSGGVEGARNGACFMVGGEREAVERVAPILEALAVPGGYVHAGGAGAGHFTKLVHNGIEFGMLQAIGEGVDLLEHYREELPVADVLAAWRHGSVIRSWLVDLMERQYRETGGMHGVPTYVDDTGEVNWLLADSLEMERPVPVIAAAVMQLFASRDDDRSWARAIAMMRNAFGGHPYGEDAFAKRERRTGRVGDLHREPER